ncbi:heterokaryon incompatibility protein-domain-containing protein [Annulohypoxylon moriforme]|nr:heterokaryon incompatibility protein-domain-containing protein [Annulohypoxylon moriforme]
MYYRFLNSDYMAGLSNFEGSLCHICALTLEGMRGTYHHQNYRSFVISRDSGCRICTWLWGRLVIRPPMDEKRSTFDISCLVVRGWDLYHTHFSIQCDWAPRVELKLSLCKQTSCRNDKSFITKPIRLWDTLDPNIGSNQSLQTIQGWISSCQEDHEHCKSFHAGLETFFPARVIDVADADSGTIYVKDREEVAAYHGKEERSGHSSTPNYPIYWTLSHRWGDPARIKQLLKTTESRLREGISLDELTPTFRDAILLVYRLGYRYIWIDSLCIFQDSRRDWHREVDTLADIYRHSFCNISAISSSYSPASTGLFGRRMVETNTLYPFVANIRVCDQSGDVNFGSWMIRNRSMWDHEIESAPLSRRGWVVQERFLARRLVHFTRSQIFWECLECTHCEAEPKESLLNLDREVVNRTGNWSYAYPKLTMAKIRTKSTAHLPKSLYDSFAHKSWRAIVTKYTSCYLTHESDKLAAISGIAKIFREFNGDRYLAGLWRDKLYLHLLWKVNRDDGEVVIQNKYAPSWSWASITGSNVEFIDVGKAYRSLIEFVDARIVTEPPGGDPTGVLRSAELDIECSLCSFLRVGGKTEIFNDEIGETRNIPCEYIFPDRYEIEVKFKKENEFAGACIPICEWRSPTARVTNFLLLKQESENRFKRIGIETIRWDAPALPRFERWASETSRITLI